MWHGGPLKQLLNRIPYEDAVSIRIQLVGHYGKNRILSVLSWRTGAYA